MTADGRQLWLPVRCNRIVSALSTKDGSLPPTIDVGDEPTGMCVWPLPCRYSLGHTGITR